MRRPRLGWRAAVAAAAVALTAGCVGDQSYRGEWEVVGYKRPQLSVLGDPEAQLWLGTTYDLTSRQAIVAGDSCEVAKAQRQTLSVFNVEMAFNLTKGELGIDEPDVEMLDIQCSAGGLPWGEHLIRLAPDSLYAPWQGIFLLLQRKRG